jgi:hypothetical protein
METPHQQGTAFVVCMMQRGSLEEGMLDRIGEIVESELGAVRALVPELRGWIAPWQYRSEMGEDLVNVGIVLEERLPVSRLVAFKEWALALERDTRICGNRTVNVNPGIVLSDRVIVASHKSRDGIRRCIGINCWIQTVATATPSGRFMPSRNTFSEYVAPSRLELLTGLRIEDLVGEASGVPHMYTSLHDGAHNRPLHLTVAFGARQVSGKTLCVK